MKIYKALYKYIENQQATINACLEEGDKRGAESLRAQLSKLKGFLEEEIDQEAKNLLILAKLIHDLQYENVEK